MGDFLQAKYHTNTKNDINNTIANSKKKYLKSILKKRL